MAGVAQVPSRETVHTVIATVDGELNEWTDTDLTGGDRRYKVAAVRDSLTSQRSQAARLVIDATPRATPGTITQVPEEKPIVAQQAVDCTEDTSTRCAATVGDAAAEGTIDSSTDYDWVKVSLADGTSYQIDLRSDGRPSIDPWIVDIYDSNGSKITRPPVSFTWAVYNGYFDHDSGPGNAARLIYTATEGGDHFIKVGSRGSSSQRPGAWHLKVTEASATFYDDFYDTFYDEFYDDFAADTSTTGRVTVGGTVSGWIDSTPGWYDAGDTGGPSVGGSEPGWMHSYNTESDCAVLDPDTCAVTFTSCYEVAGDGVKLDRDTCDRDWFAVELIDPHSYKLQLGEFYLMIIGVYNSSGELISRNDSTDNFMEFSASYSGEHYIAVAGTSSCWGAHGCTGRYTLSVTQQQ